MQKFLSKYGLAAHLGLLTVSPLFLFPYFDSAQISVALLWLSLIVVVWTLVSPSQINGEMLHVSRRRVCGEILRDPLLWTSLVVIGFAAVRWLNCGLKMIYDAESLKWSLGGVAFSMLPSGAEGRGFVEFATAVAVAVVFQTTRHALGKSARTAYLCFSSVFAGIAGIIACMLALFGHDAACAAAACSRFDPQYIGLTFAVVTLGGIVGYAAAVEHRGWSYARSLAVVAFGGGVSAVVYFSSAVDVAVFSAGVMALTIIGVVYDCRYAGSAATLRAGVLLVGAALVGFLFIAVFVPPCLNDGRLDFYRVDKLLSDDFLSVRTVMAGLAHNAWRPNIWLGTGIGTMQTELGLLASDADWMKLSPMQVTLAHGWWQLLAERGLVGAVSLALPCVFVTYTYFYRLVHSFYRHSACQPACWLAPVVVVVLVGSAFFEVSFLRSDCLLVSAALISVSSVSFHPPLKKDEAADADESMTGDVPVAGGMARG